MIVGEWPGDQQDIKAINPLRVMIVGVIEVSDVFDVEVSFRDTHDEDQKAKVCTKKNRSRQKREEESSD